MRKARGHKRVLVVEDVDMERNIPRNLGANHDQLKLGDE